MSKVLSFVVFAASLISSATLAQQGTIRIGYHADLNSLDPHFYLADPNLELAHYIFINLMKFDERSQLVPDFATSFVQSDPTTWIFNLRQDVTLSDGTPMTADDVVFSFERAGKVPNSPGSFGLLTRGKTAVALDPYRVAIKTSAPDSSVPIYSSLLPIISRKYGNGTETSEYNKGNKLIGAGPYKFVSYANGDYLNLVANERYYGAPPAYKNVRIKWLTNGPARVAALLSRDVDLIRSVPDTDVKHLSNTEGITVGEATSHRSIYLIPRQDVGTSPYITDANGKQLEKNPLKDMRVREAISNAIDRNLLVSRVMSDMAVPTIQNVPPGFGGYIADLELPAADAAKSRSLLAAAGYPQGFNLTFHCSSGRYANSERVCQAIGQMLTKGGIKTEVVVEPTSLFDKRQVAGDFALVFSGTANPTGDMTLMMTGVLRTASFFNRTGTGELEFDAMAADMLKEANQTKRVQIMQNANRFAMAHVMLIPIYFPKVTWAWRVGFTYRPRMDEQTTFMGFLGR